MKTQLRIELMPINEIKSARINPKDHDLGAIVTSIKRHGFADALVLDERTKRLVAGHGRLAALRAMMKETPEYPPHGVDARGPEGSVEWLVPVQRGWSSKNDTEADAFVVGHNRLVEVGGWNEEALAKLLEEIAKTGEEALEGVGYDADDVEEMLHALEKEAAAAVDQITEQEEPTAVGELYVKDGDLFIMGRHRLLVGDSTRQADVKRLMDGKRADCVITDPPYAIYGSSTGIGADIADDKMVRPFFETVLKMAASVMRDFAHAYVFTDWRSWAAMWEGAKRAQLSPKNCIVWDKGGGGLGASWAMTHEFVGFFAKLPPARAMSSNERTGQRTVLKPNILRFLRVAGVEREHNAQKPVGLLLELLDAGTDKGQVVIDFFGGSGSTLIACEEADRVCHMMEIDPRAAQIIVERWKRKTGKEPVCVPAPADS